MTNNLAYFNARLATALRDTAYETWDTDEIDDLATWAVRSLYPRYSRPLDPTTATVTLVTLTYYYDLPTGCIAVTRVDRVTTDSDEAGPIHGRAWEVVGDVLNDTGQIHVSPTIVELLGTLRLRGFGRYDATANYAPDDLVPLVLAKARAEAYRRVAADRERFKAWLSRNQTQNVSLNELMQMINEADNEILRLERATPRTWQGPVPGRQR